MFGVRERMRKRKDMYAKCEHEKMKHENECY